MLKTCAPELLVHRMLPFASSYTPRMVAAGNVEITAPVVASSLTMPPVVKPPHQTLPSEAWASWWAKAMLAELWNVPSDTPAGEKRCTSSTPDDDDTSRLPWNGITANGDG